MRLLLLFLLTNTIGLYAQEIDQDNVYYEIYTAAVKAKNKDMEGVLDLYKLSLQDLKNPKINKVLIENTLLMMIMTKSKALQKYIIDSDAKFMEQNPTEFLSHEPFQVKCFKCQGETILKFPCKLCNKGVCRNCKGQKRIVYRGLAGRVEVRPCPPCDSTGECRQCDLSGVGQKGCHVCTQKGTLFSSNAIPEEYKKSLDYLIYIMPKQAAAKSLLINEEMLEIAKKNELKKELQKAKDILAKRKNKELAALRIKQDAAREKLEQLAKHNPALSGLSKRESTLQHALLEFNQFFRNRERISKQSIYAEAVAIFEDNKPALEVAVTATVGRAGNDLKRQYLEAFYYFWKLRCSQNGLGKAVLFKAKYGKDDIATLADGIVELK